MLHKGERQAAAEFEKAPFIDVIETDGGKFLHDRVELCIKLSLFF
jgi:hypothetical protein